MWPTGQSCKVAHGARSATRCGDPRTDWTPAGLPEVPKRPAGGRYTFYTVGVCALLWPFAYVYAVGDFLVYVSAVVYAFAYYLIFRVVAPSLVVQWPSLGTTSTPLYTIVLPHGTRVSSPRCHDAVDHPSVRYVLM